MVVPPTVRFGDSCSESCRWSFHEGPAGELECGGDDVHDDMSTTLAPVILKTIIMTFGRKFMMVTLGRKTMIVTLGRKNDYRLMLKTVIMTGDMTFGVGKYVMNIIPTAL